MSEYGQDLIIRTKLTFPRQRRYLLQRPALSQRLLEARHYRLTIVQASTGYGKSTALASALQQAPLDRFWYGITETDRDPILFLLHLIHAFRQKWPDFGDSALDIMRQAGTAPPPHGAVVDSLSNEFIARKSPEALLVLDDFHLVNPSSEVMAIVDHLLQVLPPNLSLIIATRQRPPLASMVQWRVKGDLLDISQQDLAFSANEIEALFRTQYDLTLSPEQVQRLAIETEGWVIALQMIWQGLQNGVASSLDQILAELPRSLKDLFSYLGEEVLARQPERVQNFLLRTSVLRQLEPIACDCLLGWEGSASLLRELDAEGFFLVQQGSDYRYHHLFHDFLRQRAAGDTTAVQNLHRRAAEFFQRSNNHEEAIHHWLAAAEHERAAGLMVQASEALIERGRFDTVSEWVTALLPAVLERFPMLMYQMGEICRFTSRFDEALAWYEQAQERYNLQRNVAGASRALRGQATVYLDTVRPIKAESLLQEALRLVDGQTNRLEQARLLDLMAENMTNRGRWEEAKSLRSQAREMREEGPGPADLDVRVLLRTGRLAEARRILEERAAAERLSPASFREPRAHRETLLVLSLIYVWQGHAARAFTSAQEGIQIGQQLRSPFVEAVGYMRLGHAWQITDHPHAAGQALACYRRAMDIGERLAVPRTKSEALWGLCRFHGYRGDLAAAQDSAHQGIEVGLGVGDEWIAALIGVTLGASYVIAGHQENARHWLERSEEAFRDCGDPFGQTIALLWQCLLHQHGSSGRLFPLLQKLLNLIQTHGYDFLLERHTFLAPPDPPALVPLLIAARKIESVSDDAARLLARMDLPADLAFHPGYTLRVRTLGNFEVSRGQAIVGEGEWPREKARTLLQLLLTNRQRFMPRDEIAAALWPEADTDTAEGQFKVTLNALQGVLEPQRPPRAPTLFVQRQGSSYGLNPAAPLWIDAAVFESWITRGHSAPDAPARLAAFQQALALYADDFLPKCVYDDWCRQERDHLRRLYLNTAIQTAELLLANDAAAEAARLCQKILTLDDCLEAAYQILIRAHLQQGDRVQALRAYERCESRLRQELDVAPTAETSAFVEKIRESPAI